jgi:SH3-like domain-containing protein
MKSLSMLRVGLAAVAIVTATAMPAFARPGRVNTQSTAAVNVRYLPTTGAEAVAYVYNGAIINIVDEQINREDGYGWYQVQLPSGTRGWVRADLVQSVAANTANTANTSGAGRAIGSDSDIGEISYLNLGGNGQRVGVRTSPSADSRLQFYGYHGDRIRIEDNFRNRDGLWVKVSYPNALPGVASIGWVRRDWLR